MGRQTGLRRHAGGALLAAMFGVAACQPLPRPFAHQGDFDDALVKIPDGVGVYVTTDDGAGLATAMVEALHRAEIVATAGEIRNPASFVLRAEVGPDKVLWALTDAEGTELGRYGIPVRLDGPEMTAADPASDPDLRAGLDAAAAEVARLIKGEPAAVRQIKVHVVPVVGAPGSGNDELTRSMEAALGDVDGLVLVAEPAAEIVISGAVTVDDPIDGQQAVAVVWQVLDRDGAEIGRLDQGSDVPPGSLDRRWGETARFVALAAAAGLTDLLARMAPQAP